MLHTNLEYSDIQEVEKIIIKEELLKSIEQYYVLNQVSDFVDFNFKSINLEIYLDEKINIFIENFENDRAVITCFSNEHKLVTFTVERVFDIFFEITNIKEYSDLINYDECLEDILLFSLNWYPKILFFIQAHSPMSERRAGKFTFFVNV